MNNQHNITTEEAMMKRWLVFLLAAVIFAVVHEGMHIVMAAFYGEYAALRIHYGVFPEVQYRTPVDERAGVHWGFISGASNLATVLLGYLLVLIGERIARLRSWFFKNILFYLTVILLVADPLNLSVGPLIYGGDAPGIAVGFGVSRYVIQAISLVVLLVNRELIVQRLFPMYNVQVKHFLFRPLVQRPGRAR
jgi:hypothetical protein